MARRALKKAKNISKHIKTGSKKIRKTADQKLIESIEKSGVKFSVESNLNKVIPIRREKGEGKLEKEKIDVEEIDLKEFHEMVKSGNKNKPKKISYDEKIIMESLIKKHGTNFSKMKMDHKLNKFQWNDSQLKRIFEKYQQEKCNK